MINVINKIKHLLSERHLSLLSLCSIKCYYSESEVLDSDLDYCEKHGATKGDILANCSYDHNTSEIELNFFVYRLHDDIEKVFFFLHELQHAYQLVYLKDKTMRYLKEYDYHKGESSNWLEVNANDFAYKSMKRRIYNNLKEEL